MTNYNPFTLEGKTILVTGASSGIGRAAAIECSKAGAKVIITARNEERLRETHSQLADAEEQQEWILADMQKDEDIQSLVEQLPVLDGVVCNAGISINVPIAFIDREKIQQVLDVNTIAPHIADKTTHQEKESGQGRFYCLHLIHFRQQYRDGGPRDVFGLEDSHHRIHAQCRTGLGGEGYSLQCRSSGHDQYPDGTQWKVQ
jgi:NAD(P)-dependent dehydrogenase (short-subunit alcohol dehydrogenase family)